MSTLLDCVSGALNMIGMLGSGQSPSPEDGANGLREANLLLSNASTNRLMLFNVSTLSFVLAPSVSSYTLGPTGLFVAVPRPTFIESAQVNVGASNYWSQLSMLAKPQWDAINNMGAIADVPDVCWPDYAWPNIRLNFNPAPLASPAIKLGAWVQLQQFATLFDQIGNAFPPEYEDWIQSSLAIRLASYYDQPVTADLAARAQRAETAVMAKNAQGLGGALSDADKFQSPNLGQPLPQGPAAGA